MSDAATVIEQQPVPANPATPKTPKSATEKKTVKPEPVKTSDITITVPLKLKKFAVKYREDMGGKNAIRAEEKALASASDAYIKALIGAYREFGGYSDEIREYERDSSVKATA